MGCMSSSAPTCTGRNYEHHEQTKVVSGCRWRCPECETTGTFESVLGTLAGLMPMMYELQEKLNAMNIVFLVPSDATPGLLGQFHGRDVLRVRGIPEPLVAMPARQFPVLIEPGTDAPAAGR